MSQSLEALMEQVDQRFQQSLVQGPMTDTMDKLKHLVESDADLYQYLLFKESSDTAYRRMNSYEINQMYKTLVQYIKDRERATEETMRAMYTIVTTHEKSIKTLNFYKYVIFVLAIVLGFIMLWELYRFDPDAVNGVTRIIKEISTALGSIFKIF